MPFKSDYLLPEECSDLVGEGYPTGTSQYLWHNDKRTGWDLWKRNQHDMSKDGDSMGYNRWIIAITHQEAANWRARQKPKKVMTSILAVEWLTFRAGDVPDPRRSAVIFATSIGKDLLINITEICPNGYIHITVYYWKEQ